MLGPDDARASRAIRGLDAFLSALAFSTAPSAALRPLVPVQRHLQERT